MTLDLRMLPQDGETGKTKADQADTLYWSKALSEILGNQSELLWSVHHGKWHLLNALFMALHFLVIK